MWGWPFPLALLAGIVATVPLGALFALPAVRSRGINLAIAQTMYYEFRLQLKILLGLDPSAPLDLKEAGEFDVRDPERKWHPWTRNVLHLAVNTRRRSHLSPQ